MADRTYSVKIPAVSFERVAGGAGVRVRRDGKGDTFLVTRDERSRHLDVYLIIMHGQGVVGRVAKIDGEWIVERGIFRHWDYKRGIYQVFPSSTVHTQWGFPTMTEAVAEEALYWLS